MAVGARARARGGEENRLGFSFLIATILYILFSSIPIISIIYNTYKSMNEQVNLQTDINILYSECYLH